MNALWIAWKSFRQHAGTGCLIMVCLAVAGGLVMSGWVLRPEVAQGVVVAMLVGGIGLWAGSVVILVGCLVSSVSRRRREIAVLRMLGAGRGTICCSVLAEGIVLATVGAAGAFPCYAALVKISVAVDKSLDTAVNIYSIHGVYVWVPLIILLTGLVGGIYGGIRASRTKVTENLLPE